MNKSDTNQEQLLEKNSVAETANLALPPYVEQIGEAYMNERQRAHFRCLLLQWKQRLLAHMNRTVHHLHEAAAFPDALDRATQEEVFHVELRTRDREHNLIKKIEEALQKLDKKEYGYCDVCDAQIGIRRLEARPTAMLCIDCKTLAELRERARG